ncbi:MAG: hypothetical protein HQK68_12670 [Desulfamplus sp.]|nr:hypothetical protein [Desulfamplus sp.]
MIKLLSIEFWIAGQLFIDLVLIILIWHFSRKLRRTEIELQSVIRIDEVTELSESIYQEVVERIDRLTRNMGEKAAVEMVDRAAKDIIDLLDPMVKDSEVVASSFEHQIKEKQRLIKNLNDTLDSRIISINLLLSRAEVILNSKDSSIYQNQTAPNRSQNQRDYGSINSGQRGSRPTFDLNEDGWALKDDLSQTRKEDNKSEQQKKILHLYQKGFDIDAIASKLSMPRGEVQLIISLKEKFIKMER